MNMPQPDAYLRILAEHGGQAKVGSDGYILGTPELVGEVAASSASYDLHEKLQAYQRNGVREYVVWRTQDQAIDWFFLRGDKFKLLPADTDGILKAKSYRVCGWTREPWLLMTWSKYMRSGAAGRSGK